MVKQESCQFHDDSHSVWLVAAAREVFVSKQHLHMQAPEEVWDENRDRMSV